MLLCDFAETEVKGFWRRGKKGQVRVSTHKRKSNKKPTLANKAVLTGVGALGLGAGGLVLGKKIIKQIYANNLLEFAKTGLGKGKPKVNIPTPTKKRLTITVPGNNPTAAYELGVTKRSRKWVKDSDHFTFETKNYIPRTVLGIKDDLVGQIGGTLAFTSNPKLTDDVKDLANNIKRLQDENPGLEINLIGHSQGGNTVNDVMTVLEQSGQRYNVKAVTLGAPNLGRTTLNKNVKNIASTADRSAGGWARYPDTTLLKPKRTRKVSMNVTEDGHDIVHYWSNFKKDILEGLHS